MREGFEAIVLGLGGLGSAAAWRLAVRLGGRVLGLEQFALGHRRGESGDRSRIIRLTYHTPGYVRLARAAYAAWAEVEAAAGARLVHRTGGLDIFPADSPLRPEPYVAAMTACDVAFERLDAAGAMRRFPQFRLPEDACALWQPDGGLVTAEHATAAHQRLARAAGATLIDRMPVTGLARRDDLWQVATAAGTFRAPRLVVAAGPWTNRVLGWLGLSLKLAVVREQVAHHRADPAEAFAPGRFPVWIWMIPANFYGFPAMAGPGVKVAKDRFAPTDPDRAEPDTDAAHAAGVAGFLARHIPGAAGPVLEARTCVQTLTPDDDFVLDHLPETAGTAAVAVGAGHAYKFAALIGAILADLVLDGGSPLDLAPFRFDRPGLDARCSTC